MLHLSSEGFHHFGLRVFRETSMPGLPHIHHIF